MKTIWILVDIFIFVKAYQFWYILKIQHLESIALILDGSAEPAMGAREGKKFFLEKKYTIRDCARSNAFTRSNNRD